MEVIMADEMENQGPKDTTPNPLDEAVKDKEAAAAPAEGTAPAEGAPAEEQVDEGPQKPFFDPLLTARILQVFLIVAGIFGIFMGTGGQVIKVWYSLLGALALTCAVLLDNYIPIKIRNKSDPVETIIRYVAAGMLFLLAIFFGIQFAKPLSIPVNKQVMIIAVAATLMGYLAITILQLRKNKQKVQAELYSYIALGTGILSLFVFYQYFWAVPAMALSVVSIISIMISINKEPLRDDENFHSKMMAVIFTLLMFVPMCVFSLTYFMDQRLAVIKYGAMTPEYKTKPEHISWSKHSWEMAYFVKDKKSKSPILNIYNALTYELSEIPPREDVSRKLPEFTDMPIWNEKGDFVIFSAGDKADGPRTIWGVSAPVSLLTEEEIKAKKKEINRSKEDMPVGKPKHLITDITQIIDMESNPLTHPTAWSPDTKSFCFSGLNRKTGIQDIWSSDTKAETFSTLTKETNKIMPLWSPADKQILYVTKTDSYTYLRVSDFDGKNAHELNIGNKKDRDLFPAWNSEESRTIYIKGGRKLTIMNSNATNLKPLSKDTFTPSPYWLTAGRKKMLLDYTESGIIWKIFTMTNKGKKHLKIFEERCETMTQPKWDYDGKVIAAGVYYGAESKEFENKSSIFRLENDGKLRTRLYTGNHPIREVEWAPTSDRLAFIVDKKDSTQELWVVNNDGTEPIRLYESIGRIDHMSWNVEGTMIAFDETYNWLFTVPTLTNVKVVHAIGGEKKELLPYRFYAKYPAWSPDGQMLSYVGWNSFWMPSSGARIWAAQIE